MADTIRCIYSLDEGYFCTKHSNAFYDASCRLLEGKPCEDQKPVVEPCNNLSKPFKTNADRIRSLTDEELAEFFMKEYDGEDSFTCPVPHPCPTSREASCKQCFLDWLRQEATT